MLLGNLHASRIQSGIKFNTSPLGSPLVSPNLPWESSPHSKTLWANTPTSVSLKWSNMTNLRTSWCEISHSISPWYIVISPFHHYITITSPYIKMISFLLPAFEQCSTDVIHSPPNILALIWLVNIVNIHQAMNLAEIDNNNALTWN